MQVYKLHNSDSFAGAVVPSGAVATWMEQTDQGFVIKTKDHSGNIGQISGGGGTSGGVTDVKVNGESVVTSGVASVVVPTQLSALAQDSTHRLVTDDLKNTWSAKQDAITSSNKLSYTLLSDTPTIPVNSDFTLSGLAQKSYNNLTDTPTIPTSLAALSEDSTHRLVTDTQKSTWNDKQAAITQSNKLAYSLLSDTPTIPSTLSQLSQDDTHKVVTVTQKATWNGKADKATTLQGYDISDAYTKTEVDQKISTQSATFRGNFSTKAALDAYTGQKDNNDYAVVLSDQTHTNECWRYKYNSTTWSAQYRINQVALTQTQLAAINSGITSSKVTKLDGIQTAAEVNIIQTVKVDGTQLTVTDKAVDIDLSGKVDKVTGKSLLADSQITRLSGLSNYTLPIATASALGGVIINGNNLSINSSTGLLSATDTTYTNGTGLSLSGTTFSVDNTVTTQGNTFNGTEQLVKTDSTGKIPSSTYVDTTYSVMNSSTLGLGKLFSDTIQSVTANTVTATSSRTYGIQLNSSNQLVVNVPWTDTDTTYEAKSAVQEGTQVSLVTTGQKYIWNNKADSSAIKNSTITLTQGGVTKGSFTLNQSTASTISLQGSSIETLTAIAAGGTMLPDGHYSITLSANTTLNAGGGTAGKVGAAELYINPGTYTFTAGTNLTLVNSLDASKTNHCTLNWNGTSCRMYKIDSW